jgi:hypothetical protein
MRRIRIVRNCLNRFFLFRRRRLVLPAGLLVLIHVSAASAAETIAVFPTTPYEGYIVYESLAVFWIAIIGLIVIIRMKLREIERTQALGADHEENDAPLLQ